jgi:peptidoglycan/LPS O-acetylase OafA/YrhL
VISSSSRLDTDIALRALAIAAVVFNHAHVYGVASIRYTGGMTVLMMLSGLAFARFALTGGQAAGVHRTMWGVGKRLALLSVLMALVSFAYMGESDWSELLLISNWFQDIYVARFPIWYPEVLLQMYLGIALFFALPPLANRFFAAPLRWSLGMLVLAIVFALAMRALVDTRHLSHRLPHLLLWNFILGWAVFFVGQQAGALRAGKLFVIALAVVAGVAFWGWSSPAGLWLGLAVAMLLWVPRLPSVPALTRIVSSISQASLTIFFLHTIALGAYRALFPGLPSPVVAFVFAMLACLAAWLVLAANATVTARLRQERLHQARTAVAQ